MRRWNRLRLAGLLVLGSSAAGFAEPPKEEQPDARVKAILREYDRAASSFQEIHYRFTQTTEDTTFNIKETTTGQVFYRKPDLIRIDWKTEKGETTHILVEDRKVHVFNIQRKTETIYWLPKEFGFPERPEEYPKDQGFFVKLGGGILEIWAMQYLQFPTRDLEQDCQVRLKSEDKDWIVLEFKPRTKRFKRDFARMEVVLSAKTFQVQHVSLEEANGSLVHTTNRVVNPEKGIGAESIREGLPQGLKREEIGKKE